MHRLVSTIRICDVVFILVFVCRSLSIQKEINITMEIGVTSYASVLSGWVVHLQCQLSQPGYVVFNFNSTAILVKKSTLVESPVKYQYKQLKQSGKVLHVLTITNVAKSDEGRYYCWQGNSRAKQRSLKVWRVPEKKPRCTMSPSGFSSHDINNKNPYQVNCTTIEKDLQTNITLFLNDQRVTKNITKTISKVGKNVERTLSFSSNFGYVSNNSFFYCKVTQELQSPYLHYEQNFSCRPVIILPTPETAGTPAVTTQLLQKNANMSTTRQPIKYRREVILFVVSVAGFLLMFSPPFVIGIKCIRQSLFKNSNCKNKQRGKRDTAGIHHSPGEPMESVEPTIESRNDTGHAPPGTGDGFFAGRNLLQRFIVLVVVVILSCGVAILPILIYFIIKKFTGSKNDFAGRQSFALPEIPAAVEESEYEEYSKIPEEIDQPYSPSCSNVPEYAECDMNNIPSCKYSTTLNDVTQVKLFYEKDMRKSKTIKAGPLYIRWTGTVAFTHDKVKRVMYTSVTDKALASNIVQWDKFLKRVVELPKSKHLLRIAGIGIDNGRQYLIHERLFRGSLAAYIKSASESTDSYKPLLPEHIIRLVLGILEGMEHIHSAGFLHPGLSTKKVLLNYKGVGKLYDFYLSDDAVNVLTIKRPGMNYSLNELAPEGIRRHQYSAASDVWSTAVLIWQMLSDGSLPFRHDNNVNVDAETIPILPKTWPKKFEYLRNCLLFDCWNTNESGRPTISELKRSIQKSTDVDTYNLPKMHGGSMAGYYMPMKKSMIDSDT